MGYYLGPLGLEELSAPFLVEAVERAAQEQRGWLPGI